MGAVWSGGASKLSLSPRGALGLFSPTRLGASGGRAWARRGPPARLLPRCPRLAFPAVFGSCVDGHGTMGGTQHRTQDWRSPCRQGTTWGGGSRGRAAPRDMQAEETRRPRDAEAAAPAKRSGRKQPLLGRGRSLDAPSARERCIVGRQWAPCRRPHGHGHRHQHGHTGALGSDTVRACV